MGDLGEKLMRDAVDRALTSVMYGYDGALLTGDFWPGHEAIVDAVIDALNEAPVPATPENIEKARQRWEPLAEAFARGYTARQEEQDNDLFPSV